VSVLDTDLNKTEKFENLLFCEQTGTW